MSQLIHLCTSPPHYGACALTPRPMMYHLPVPMCVLYPQISIKERLYENAAIFYVNRLVTLACLVLADPVAIFVYFGVGIFVRALEELLHGRQRNDTNTLQGMVDGMSVLLLVAMFASSWFPNAYQMTDVVVLAMLSSNIFDYSHLESTWFPLAVMMCYCNGPSHVDLMRLVAHMSLDRTLANKVLLWACGRRGVNRYTIRKRMRVAVPAIGALRCAVLQIATQTKSIQSFNALAQVSLLNICAVVLSACSVIDCCMHQASTLLLRDVHCECIRWRQHTLASASAFARHLFAPIRAH